jgi:hypothetical protein
MQAWSAFGGAEAAKRAALARLAAHLDADEVGGGTLAWEDGRGSVCGCLAQSGSAADFEQSLGLPRAFAGLVDFLSGFIERPDARYRAQPAQWLEAIAPGADLSGAPAAYVVSLFKDDPGALLRPDLDPTVATFIQTLLDVHQAAAAGRASDSASLRSLRRQAVGLSNDRSASLATDGPDDLALRAAEAAAWPIAGSVSVIVEVVRVHLKSGIDVFGSAAKEAVNWSHADDKLLERYYADVRKISAAGEASLGELAKVPRYKDVLDRLQHARAVFDASKAQMMQPYWDRLSAVSRGFANA